MIHTEQRSEVIKLVNVYHSRARIKQENGFFSSTDSQRIPPASIAIIFFKLACLIQSSKIFDFLKLWKSGLLSISGLGKVAENAPIQNEYKGNFVDSGKFPIEALKKMLSSGFTISYVR